MRAAKCDAVIDCMFDIQAAIRPSIYETNAQRKVSKYDSLGLCPFSFRLLTFWGRGPRYSDLKKNKRDVVDR